MASDDATSFWSDDRRLGFSIAEPAMQRIRVLCSRALPNETGGILVGFYTPGLDFAIVSGVSPAPSDSKSGMSWFQRGVRGLQRWIDSLWRRQRRYYLGEWHFHPYGLPFPSTADIMQMKSISESEAYHCPEPILLILCGNPDGPHQWAVYVFPRGELLVELIKSTA